MSVPLKRKLTSILGNSTVFQVNGNAIYLLGDDTLVRFLFYCSFTSLGNQML